MDESMTDFKSYADQVIETSKELTKISTAENSSQIQSKVLELKQTNIVKYDNQIESTLVSDDNLNRIANLCQKAKANSFPIAELYLGIATLFTGAIISAVISGITFQMGWRTIAFYTISPAIAVGCFIAYFFKRKYENLSKSDLATRILEYLPVNKEANK